MRRAAWLAAAALAAQTPAPSPDADKDLLVAMLSLRRVYVDKLTGGEDAARMRDLLISSLRNSRLFIITEDAERADAFLRGAAGDEAFTDTFQSAEGTTARGSLGVNSSEGASRTSRASRSGVYLSGAGGDNESFRSSERKHEAIAAVRLVSREGDVLWSTTQESLGAKFKSAAADVADKVAKQLALDIERARRFKPAQ